MAAECVFPNEMETMLYLVRGLTNAGVSLTGMS